MKFKTVCRMAGVLDATVFGYFGYKFGYKTFSDIDYDKLGDFFSGNYPLEYKIGFGALLGTTAVVTSLMALGITDGLVDISKGTDHYFGCRLWRGLTRSQKRKEEIDKALDKMLELRELPIFYKTVK